MAGGVGRFLPWTRTHIRPSTGPGRESDWLAALAAIADGLASRDLDGLREAVLVELRLEARRRLDRLDGHWHKELAGVDGWGAAGRGSRDSRSGSTAGWLRNRLRRSGSAASQGRPDGPGPVPGPLTETARAVSDGELSVTDAEVLAVGTHHLTDTYRGG